MKIYSWNMLYRNRDLDRAFAFIAESDFDIFCLQEVPEEFLKRLQTLPYHIASRSERELLLKEGPVHNFVVTISKRPITAQGEIPFPDYLLPLRTRLFVWLMKPFGFAHIRNRGALYIDVSMGGAPLRIFNLHLILAQPAWRLKEFEAAMVEHDLARPAIVCGDFNILEKPYIATLNWLLGGRARDVAFYQRERTTIEKRFVEHQLTNPLRGFVTHPLSQSQLDHILVSHSFSIKNAEVVADRVGSDHHPIRVEVA